MTLEPSYRIETDDLMRPEIVTLLTEHAREMERVTPRGSCHYLDLEGLRHPSVTFWSLWKGDALMGCGALKALGGAHGEVKSMRTASAFLRQGVASKMLEHIIAQAREHGYTRLSLETGSMPYFEPARTLYARFGFTVCPPFGEYRADPNSVFMSRSLT